jgi:hypothetical protein
MQRTVDDQPEVAAHRQPAQRQHRAHECASDDHRHARDRGQVRQELRRRTEHLGDERARLRAGGPCQSSDVHGAPAAARRE